jgi:hypothetical protein
VPGVGSDALDESWTTDVDLVVVTACCPGAPVKPPRWSPTLLDRVGEARVLACGAAGIALCDTKKLLVGLRQARHYPKTSRRAPCSIARHWRCCTLICWMSRIA